MLMSVYQPPQKIRGRDVLLRRIIVSFFPVLFIFQLCIFASARDINLDSIYIKKSSPLYSKLLQKKLEVYQEAGARFVDREVIFARWLNGVEVLYLVEREGITILNIYNRVKGKRREVARFSGTVTDFQCGLNRPWCYINRIRIKKGIPSGEIICIKIGSGRIKPVADSWPFRSFTLSTGGNSIFYETHSGIVEYFPALNRRRLLVGRKQILSVKEKGAPVLAYLSPNRKKVLLLSGNGGHYRTRIISRVRVFSPPGVTSATEIFWVSNIVIAYRSGGTGNFRALLFNTVTGKRKILIRNSMNTNLNFSRYPEILSFLKDQLISIYSLRNRRIFHTGLEGEDVHFSPDGNRFLSLYLRKLFITHKVKLKKKIFALKKPQREIIKIYRRILRTDGLLLNSYSAPYIKRKISVYKRIID